MSKIYSGPLGSIFKAITKYVSKGIDKGVDWIISNGYDVDPKDVKFDKDTGIFTFLAETGSGDTLRVKCIPVSGKVDKDGKPTMYDVYIKSDNGKRHDYPHVTPDKFTDVMVDYVERYMDGSGMNTDWDDIRKHRNLHDEDADIDINESKKFSVGLTRITNSKKPKMKVTGIFSCCGDPYAIAENIQLLANDPEFVSSIPDNGAFYEVSDVGDALEVTPVESMPSKVDMVEEATYEILRALHVAEHTLRDVHWRVSGPQFMTIHTMTDEYIEYVLDMIDEVAENLMSVNHNMLSYTKIVEGQGSLVAGICDNLSEETGLDAVYACLSQLGLTLSTFRDNFSPEFQSKMDEWISYLKIEACFKVPQMY